MEGRFELTSTAKAVEAALRKVEPRLAARTLRSDLSLVADLGIDSIRFAELACVLEDQLDLPPAWLQRWADEEAMKSGKRYTLGALVDACERRGPR